MVSGTVQIFPGEEEGAVCAFLSLVDEKEPNQLANPGAPALLSARLDWSERLVRCNFFVGDFFVAVFEISQQK